MGILDIAPNSKSETWIETTGPGDVPIRVPVGVIRGAKDGPVFTCVAGVHGTEYDGIEAAIRLHRDTGPADLSGTLVTAIANMPSVRERSMYVCPVDNKNLGRYFPGRLDAGYSEALAHTIFNSVIAPADYMVDLHGGDLVEDLVVYTSYHVIDDETINEKARAMALAFGAPFLVVKQLPEGQTFTTGGAYDAAARAGKVAVLTEAGGNGIQREETTRAHLDGILNMLRHVRMLKGAVKEQPEPVWLGKFIGVAAPAEGIFYPSAAAGDRVRTGQHLGELRDYFGKKTHDITSPADAIVLGVITAPPMKEGSMLYGLGELL